MTRRTARTLLPLLLAMASPVAAAELTTTAERTGFEHTGRYDEVERLCRDFERAEPRRVRCDTFGTTPEGRPMVALVASADGALDPAAARRRHRGVVLAQGGIHAGEIDGKDAGFIVLRELLAMPRETSPLAKVTFVLVPVFNVDGHERFGPNHRMNQVGPAESGWRTTAQNLNLNRDFAKLDAPETRALVGLLDAWDPEVFLDLHVTDGAHFRHDVAVMIEPAEAGPEPLREPARALRSEVLDALEKAGHLPLPFYPSFEEDADPKSGTAVNAWLPRFAHGYWGWRERLGVLVETHSWKPYEVRVRATKVILHATIAAAARDAASWRDAARRAEREAASLGDAKVPVEFTKEEPATTIELLGVAYERVPSPISGALVTQFHPGIAETWRVPFHDRLEPKVVVTPPRGGYLVPPAQADDLVERLDLHGIRWERLREPTRLSSCESWTATEVKFPAAPFEGRFSPEVKGAWTAAECDLRAGTLFVPIAQPRGRLVAQLFEPEAPDSFLRWGFFNAFFERKEYLEAYVAEDIGRRMLADDPKIAAEFRDRLAEDEAFAKDPSARLEFFYRKHPSWDERVNRCPVMRTELDLLAPPGRRPMRGRH